MCKIMVVANQKGGVAKTSTVRNLSYSIAELGKRVLAVDFDAQFNLTTCFGIENPNELKHTIATLMTSMLDEEEIPSKKEYIISIGKVDLIPSSIQLSVVDANLRLEMGSDRILSNLLESLRNDYDYIIVDTCPSLGTLTINALTAADNVIIPVNPQLLAVMGLQELTKTILKIKRRLNPRIEFGGILLTMCDKRTNLYKEISAQVDAAYRNGMRIFDSQIPSTVKVGEANCCGMSVLEYDKKCPAGQAYMELAREVLEDA
jgi:chromosome partitioning protein